MGLRTGLATIAVAFVLVAVGGVLPARVHWPFGAVVAQAQADCDGDGDGGQDLNEYGECYEPPPLPEHPFADDQKQTFREMVWQAWSTCTAAGRPLPAPMELPGPPVPGLPQFPSQVLQTYYTILANQFAAMCGDLGALGAYAASMLSVDPPDPNSAVVPVPSPVAGTRLFVRACRHLPRRFRADCRGFAAAAFSYAAAVRRAVTFAEAMAIAGNRFAIERLASENFNNTTSASQAANADLVAEHAYAGELAASDEAIHTAGLALAKALNRIRLDVRFTVRQVRTMRHALSTLQGLPSGFVASLRRDALDPKAIKSMLSQQLAKAKNTPFDLIALLSRRHSTSALTAAYDSTTVSQLADLVAALTSGGAASKQANIALNDDLQNAQQAANRGQRISAMKQFVADSHRLVTGPYSALLQIAPLPLTK